MQLGGGGGIQSELSVERSGAKISPYSEPPKLQSPLKLESGSWQNSWWIGLMSEEWNKTQHMSEPEVLGLRVIVPRWMPCVQLEGAAPELGCAAFPTRSLLRKLGPFNAWIAKWTFSPLSSLASSQVERALRGGPPRLLRSCLLLLITVYSQQETSSANTDRKNFIQSKNFTNFLFESKSKDKKTKIILLIKNNPHKCRQYFLSISLYSFERVC